MTALTNTMIEGLLVKYPEAQSLIDNINKDGPDTYDFDRDALLFIIALRTSKTPADVMATFCRLQHNINKQIDLAQLERRRNIF